MKTTSEGKLVGEWPIREERVFFGLVRCRKVGRIVILWEWRRDENQRTFFVLGPYYHFLLATLLVIIAITVMVYGVVVPKEPAFFLERVCGVTLSVLAIASLLCTALSDPGIFPRYAKPLADDWTYSEYAESYRPPGTIYCQQCQVLVEDYNHFCPWSGIVIGKGNEHYFRIFIVALSLKLIYDATLIILALLH